MIECESVLAGGLDVEYKNYVLSYTFYIPLCHRAAWKAEVQNGGWALNQTHRCVAGEFSATPAATFWLSGFRAVARRAVNQPWLKGKALNQPPSRDLLETGMRTTRHK